MRLTPFGVRWDVIAVLQSIRQRAIPGSGLYEQADYAIGLALGPKRQAENPRYLFRNVWRDAARITRRSRATRRTEPLEEIGADDYGRVAANASTATPEHTVLAQDMETRIRSAIRKAYPRSGEACLDRLLAGFGIAEAAMALGISARRVKHIRARIRSLADKLGLRETA